MGDLRNYSTGMGGFEWRRMGFDNDVSCVTNLVVPRLCVRMLMDASLDESKREKGGRI